MERSMCTHVSFQPASCSQSFQFEQNLRLTGFSCILYGNPLKSCLHEFDSIFSMGFILSWTMRTLTPPYNWIEFSSVELKTLAKMFIAANSLGNSQRTIYTLKECSKLCKKLTWTTQSGRSFYYYKLFCNTWTRKNTMI